MEESEFMKASSTRASKTAAKAPEVGKMAPDFTALTGEGEKIRLRDLRGRPVIIYFYPKDDTPGCTKQSCGFRDLHPKFRGKKAVILGVSPDGEKSHQKFRSKYSLPFQLLVDQDHTISQKFGVWGEKSNYGRKYMGMIRSHFVIGEDGRILDARVNVKAVDSPELALEALSRGSAKKAAPKKPARKKPAAKKTTRKKTVARKKAAAKKAAVRKPARKKPAAKKTARKKSVRKRTARSR
jgi:peroxiredoxin Q/BCP